MNTVAKVKAKPLVKRNTRNSAKQKQGFRLFLFTTPLLIAVFVFSYLPLAFWSVAFFDYRLGFNLLDTPFVGLNHFTSLFANVSIRMDFFRVLRNTLGMSFLAILVSPLPMFFAIALSEARSKYFSRITQTISTIPNFLSWVLIYALAFSMLSVNTGVVNNILVEFGREPHNFLASPNNVWITMTLYGVWRGLGWGAIIYIAAISGIDQELFEAADIDGASRMQRIRYIKVPCLLPTFFVLLLLSIGNFLNSDFERVFVFSNAMNIEAIETIDLFVFNRGLTGRNVPLATAVGMSRSLVSLVLLFTANALSKLFREESIF